MPSKRRLEITLNFCNDKHEVKNVTVYQINKGVNEIEENGEISNPLFVLIKIKVKCEKMILHDHFIWDKNENGSQYSDIFEHIKKLETSINKMETWDAIELEKSEKLKRKICNLRSYLYNAIDSNAKKIILDYEKICLSENAADIIHSMFNYAIHHTKKEMISILIKLKQLRAIKIENERKGSQKI
jgi:hypothetical protein